jgi:hypothetical protein
MPWLFHGGTFGALTIAGWIATLVLGPPAAVLLWNRQNLGRILAAICWAIVCAYYIYPAIFLPNSRVSVPMVGSGLLVILLGSPAARRACDGPTTGEKSVAQA